ncbi:MAG: alkaline phosphatase family protein [Bacillota bacterium]
MASSHPRTVVLGFDGIDAQLTEALLRQGCLPNLKAMAELGGFHRVLSTTPAESAVAWASFATGANPGRTGVFDFIERQPGTYSPRLAGSEAYTELTPMGPRWAGVGLGSAAGAATGYLTARRMTRREWIKGCALAVGAGLGLMGTGVPLVRWLPRQVERVRSTVAGQTWWDRLSEMGRRCTVLRMPMTYPAHAASHVELLAGLGVPDLRGTQGTYCVITDGPGDRCGHGEVCRVEWKRDQCEVAVGGGREVYATMKLKRLGEDAVRTLCGGTSQILRRGEWSGWLPLKFAASPLATNRGMVRVHFCQEAAGMRLYVTPAEWDPTWPIEENPISSPAGFAREVCQGVGRYHSLGWETQTWGLTDGVLDEEAYLADVRAALEWNEAQLEWGLQRAVWDELMLVVQATDQVQHLFFDDAAVAMRKGGKVDEGHPLVEVYRRMDRMVGRVLNQAKSEGWRVVVMSDHGFAPYRRAANLNTWLAKRGWLAPRTCTA